MNSPVVVRVVACGDQDRVSLSDAQRDHVGRGLCGIGSVSFDDTHVVTVDPEPEHCERSGVDDSQTIGSTGDEGDLGIVVEPWEISAIVRKVDDGGF